MPRRPSLSPFSSEIPCSFQVTVVNRPGKWLDLCQGLKMPENPAIWSAVAMLDHFEKIQKLKDKVDGVPNFR